MHALQLPHSAFPLLREFCGGSKDLCRSMQMLYMCPWYIPVNANDCSLHCGCRMMSTWEFQYSVVVVCSQAQLTGW